MARGIGDVTGWPAVAWVAGMGAATLLSAGVLWLRARSIRDQPAELPTYRTAGSPGSRRASELRGLAVVLVGLCVISQLLYVGLWLELVQWLLGDRDVPRITGDLFFWGLLVNGTSVGGALYTGLRSDRHSPSSPR